MITGITRPFSQSLRQVRRVIDDEQGATPFGVHIVVGANHTVFIADTTVTERPTAEQLAAIAMRAAGVRPAHGARAARRLPLLFDLRQSAGHATRGTPRRGEAARRARRPTSNMKARWARTSRSTTRCSAFYPFSRLSGPANVLVMPGLQSANISAKLLRELGGESVLGPYLVGHGAAGPDRADDGDRVRPGDAGGARRGGADAIRKPRSEGLDPLDLADAVGGAQARR